MDAPLLAVHDESMAIGIDFGTSNSALAVGEAGAMRVLTLPHALTGEPADVSPTVLFFPEYERETHFGHAAVARYLFTGLEGRFVQSMKTFLSARSFTATQIRGKTYTIEDLVAELLTRLVRAAEQSLGLDRTQPIVLGRPARFSLDADADALAETRLLEGARRAGLREVRLLIEPVAAALAYEQRLTEDERVLVADLGGGTSDFTVMEVGPSHRGRADRRASILASGGVPIAGDKLDAEIVRTALLPLFGLGSSYVAFTDPAPVPHWIFSRLLQWNHVSFLKSRETLSFLQTVHRSSTDQEAIGRLLRLVEEDQGYLLFRAVERAKRALATADRATIEDRERELVVEADVDRASFEAAVTPLVDQLHATAVSTVTQAGLGPREIDAVFMTGGTSLVPIVRERFAATFGAERLRGGGTFTSVVEGLAYSGSSAPM